jgi:hypothetical protein
LQPVYGIEIMKSTSNQLTLVKANGMQKNKEYAWLHTPVENLARLAM